MIFINPPPSFNSFRRAINDAYRMDETTCIDQRLSQAELSSEALNRIEKIAEKLIIAVRKERFKKGRLDAFLYEYDLSSEEGIALMCLAEALLRVPDNATVHQLIRDKITPANWQAHVGESESFFVNAATWSLMLTGKILTRKEGKKENLTRTLQRFLEQTSQPVIHTAVRQAMKILGQQFVMGQTIQEALKRAKANEEKGYWHSFDMLGEAARTAKDAERYYNAYREAISVIQQQNTSKDLYQAAGISVKLSAIHPRYEFAQRERALPEVIDKVRMLALQARDANISLNIDAEEADRLDISLDVIEAIVKDKAFIDWSGFGFALQAYQKRAYPVLQWLIDLAREQKRHLNVRLVKGAYWDYEIKDTQIKGLSGYPVFTRKAATDVSYIACAKLMISAQDFIYPQFATHNAQTIAVILELMKDNSHFEFQCLHGMGHALYDHIVSKNNLHCRIYAPVGTHKELLAYLVRRLLENGANTSFVNRIIDAETPIKDLVEDPMSKMKKYESKLHPKIPLPSDIFGKVRKNSRGLDLSNEQIQKTLDEALTIATQQQWEATSLIGKKILLDVMKKQSITDPADRRRVVGTVILATDSDVEQALARAENAVRHWDEVHVDKRAHYLEQAANLFEQNMPEFMALAIREAGKNIFDALGEVREAIDFCRYYAAEARRELTIKNLQGFTGETNQLQMHGRGITVCISPWNFPLAIFVGQIAAALVTGNPVIAKPAEQTPLIAIRAVQLFYEAGFPDDVLQLLPGKGEVIGAKLVADSRVKMVVFTGSTETARIINQTLANREGSIPQLIAETGGQNAMIVDSTALPEQVVTDVISSAFNSAGQRCSALRVLFLQAEVADKIIHMLQGAMAELQIGDPGLLVTDIGPVIDEDACKMLQKHLDYLKQIQAKLIYQVKLSDNTQYGTYFSPCAYEIPELSVLKREVFGPILHVIRYDSQSLDNILDSINATGYGLTLGIHTRINEKMHYIQNRIRAGNAYVNRNIIGAVVGVQPFGGEGLSGTGPKAGGPHYLSRFCVERTLTINTTAAGGNASLMSLGE